MPLNTITTNGVQLRRANYRQWLLVCDRNNPKYRGITVGEEPIPPNKKGSTTYQCAIYVIAAERGRFGFMATPGLNRLDILGEATPEQIQEYRDRMKV